MSTATALNEDIAIVVGEEVSPRQFSWSAVFAGASVATTVTLLLLTLGAGVGLSLLTARNATESVTFLTAGAIYFLAAQAFGFAVGGHIVGRMIGPALETDRDEEVRAGTHGLVAWALAVVATAVLIALSIVAGSSATASGAVGAALASTNPPRSDTAAPSPVTAYWVDTLFRAPSGKTALLSPRQYAQADNGAATDATPPPSDTAPDQTGPPANSTAEPGSPPPASTMFLNGTASAPVATAMPTTASGAPLTARSLAADKAEAGRILMVGMANGDTLSSDDRAQLARIVANDTGMGLDPAVVRVNDVVGRIHADEIKSAETARKTAARVSLWTAFSLLFGAIVSVAAAISARWRDDKEHGILPGTRVSEMRF